MDFLDKLTAGLAGKRTYLVALVVAVLAGAQALGYTVPDYVLQVLAALGLYTVRAAINTGAARA